MRTRYSLIVFTIFALLRISSPAVGQPPEFTGPVPADGIVTECTVKNHAEVFLWVTDTQGTDINAPPYPRHADIGTRFDLKQCVTFPKIPKTIQVGGTNGPLVDIKDIHQIVDIRATSGERSDLLIESILFDPATNVFALANIFGTLAERVGFGREVVIPDLYADTNGDGTIGQGDVLYSLVDLNVYLNDIPSFLLGESFSITNGVSSALPGMTFSTTPFIFDPKVGFVPSGPVTSGLLDGTGIADSQHGLTAAIPVPATITLLGTGTLGLLAYGWRRRQPKTLGCSER